MLGLDSRCQIKTEKTPDEKKRQREEGRATPRRYEFLDITLLYEMLKDVVAQSVNRAVIPSHTGHEVRMLVCLIALTGTDFSRGLPQVSGATVYDRLPDLWASLCSV